MTKIQSHPLSRAEVAILDSLVSLRTQRVLGFFSSVYSDLAEPGMLCQGIGLETEGGSVYFLSSCHDLGDFEIFRVSVVADSHPCSARLLNDISPVTLSDERLGALDSWEALRSEKIYERKDGQLLKACVEWGVLLRFENDERVLVTVSGLPYFLVCFTDAGQIDFELSSAAGASSSASE